MSARRRWLQWALGAGLGIVFLYASVEKIETPREFARIVYHYQLLGPSMRLGFLPANLLAVCLPWIEAVVGFVLISGAWRREAALVSAALLVMFLVAVSFALLQGIDIENCGCFSVSGEGRRAGLMLVLGDLGLLAVASFLAWSRTDAAVTRPSA